MNSYTKKANMSKRKLIRNVKPGEPIRADWTNALVDAVNSRGIVTGTRNVWLGSGGSSTPCPFGQLKSGKVLGGVIHCGDKNYDVDDFDFSSITSGSNILYISVTGVTPNRDDDEELLLPGVDTCSLGSITSSNWLTASSLPDNTSPDVESDGTIILPIASYTKDGSGVTWSWYGCGNFTITHCAGTLSYYRSGD